MFRALALLTLTVLLSAALPAGAAGPGETRSLPADERLRRSDALHKKLQKSVDPMLQDLMRLQTRYPLSDGRDELARRREALHDGIDPILERMKEIEAGTRDIEKELAAQTAARGFETAFSRRSLGSMREAALKGMSVTDVVRKMTDFSNAAYRLTRHDHALFEKTSESLARGRRLRAAAAACAAGAVLIPGFLFLRSRLGRRAAAGGPAGRPPHALREGATGGGPPAAAGTAPETVGGHFKIEEELGRGGMGVVFRARDTELDRPVALKRMREELTRSSKELEMFLKEARLVAALKHPALAAIHSFFREDEALYLVFELVEGTPLDKVLERDGPMPPGRALEILRPAVEALDYAHSKRVIHRDLKPSNIMVAGDGAKLMDFGIAHQAKKTVAKITHADAWGTPPYMAPEQELGKVTRESDLFALGACLYEMLTGEPAFRGPDFLERKRAMDFVPPSKLAKGLPRDVDSVVSRALQADPAKRFHSGAELSEAFEAAIRTT